MKQFIKMTLMALTMTAFLYIMVQDQATKRASGTEVVLQMTPQDPRDFFLGYYSNIRTELSRMDVSLLDGDDTFVQGEDIFVTLEIDGSGLWHPVSLHNAMPQSGIFIHGRVQRAVTNTARGEMTTDPETREITREKIDGTLLIVISQFNIERYFASKNEAQSLDERLRNQADIRLIIAIGSDGNAVIKGLEIDGERTIDSIWS